MNEVNKTGNGAQRIQRLRSHLGFSQRQMADEFHVTHGAIGLWESGERPVQGPMLRLLEIYEEELGLKSADQNDPLHEIDEIISSRFSRNVTLAHMASKAFSVWTGHLVKSKFFSGKDLSGVKKKSYVNLAKEVIETLSQMKGLPMKIGQTISYHEMGMPADIQKLFEKLQTTSSAMSQKTVTQIIRDELGDIPKKIFAKWSAQPFAAASIGQVHFAKLHSGENVAVKIQYPGVARALRSDLKNVELFTKLGKLIFGPTDAAAIVQEMGARFNDECDYQKEAESQQFFENFFEGRPEFYIPQVFSQFTRKHIICTEYVEGRSFQDFLTTATQSEKNRVGEILWQFYFESIFKAHRINADPHPGNYLIKDDSVVFLDYGCSSHYSPVFIKNWKKVLLSSMNGDEKTLNDTLIEMGMIAKGDIDQEQLREIVKAIYEPYLHEGPYTFHSDYVKKSFSTWFLSSRSRQNFVFRSEWIFLTRILFGLSSILAQLDAKADWKKKMTDLLQSENRQPLYGGDYGQAPEADSLPVLPKPRV